MPDHNKQHRPRLDRAKVLAEAISLADAEGLDALSMRALATRMGVVPMALYKHVADKDDLIGGMVDAVVASYPDPPAAGSWRERVRSRILAAHATATVHPWLSRAIETRTRRTETIFGHMNAVAGDFIDGGFSPDLTHHAMHVLGHRVWGFSPEAFDDSGSPPSPSEAADPTALADRFPHIMAITRDSMARTDGAGCDSDREFAFALDLLLDAFERLHAAGWQSRAPEGTTG